MPPFSPGTPYYSLPISLTALCRYTSPPFFRVLWVVCADRQVQCNGKGNAVSHKDEVFFRTFVGVLIGLLVFMFVIIAIARMISGATGVNDPANDPWLQARMEETLAPMGQVKVGDQGEPAGATQTASADGAGGGAAAASDGQQVYQSACAACHATGAAGAPKLDDQAAWEPRVAKGKDTLYDHAINGFGAMPAKGGRADLSDAAVKAAVDYIFEQQG